MFYFSFSDIFHCIKVQYCSILFWYYCWLFLKFYYIFLTIQHLLLKRHIFSFIKTSSICTHFWKLYTQSSKFFTIFVTNKSLKILFAKGNLIRYYYFINIYIVYRNRAIVLVEFVFFNSSIAKLFINFLSIFIYTLKDFYNF